jgi:hypothetical protein
MSERELGRVEVLARVKGRQLRLVDAGGLMRLSYRQTKRLWKRYREEGATGLRHRSAGRRSHRAYPEKFRRRVLERVREKYGGVVGERLGPTLAAEHLAADDGLEVDAETLRRWMLGEGLWSRERRRRRHRRRRERKEHFGELVQMDGSFHPWLEERGPEGCLMDRVDDATNTTLARLGEEETIWAAAGALRAWGERYGVPQALYVDWKNLYKRAANAQERRRGEEPVTQFGRMCRKLGIELIAASSPQAKGRVERVHGTHQDRLVKKLRLRKIGPRTRRPTPTWKGSIGRSTTGALGAPRYAGRIITGGRPRRRNWRRFSVWRQNGCWARTGWCATRTGFSNSSRGAGATRRHAER